jgi:endoglucanase
MKKLIFVLLIWIFSISDFNAQIFVNQAGYLPEKNKITYFNYPTDSFYVVSKLTGSILFKGEVVPKRIGDPATGKDLFAGDFSSLKTNGKFFIKDSKGDKSHNFKISPFVFEETLRKSLKGFYFQRCGVELHEEHAGEYKHAECHLEDGAFHPQAETRGKADVTGGWHDAGDYGKYVVNAGITVGTLLMAYEMFPEKFSTDDLYIPESGNQIPDILDEIRFELDWLFKMQRMDGAVYFKVTHENFEPFIMPEHDKGARLILPISSTATADYASVMARAYRIFSKFDKPFAIKCLSSAEKAWKYLSENSEIFPKGGFKNPQGTRTGEYGDGNDSDERLWAAAELYLATGNDVYHNYFLEHYNKPNSNFSTMSWPNVKPLAYLTYIFGDDALVNKNIQSELKNSLIEYSNVLVDRARNDGFNVSILPEEYVWGSTAVVLNSSVLLICAHELTKNIDYYNTALHQLNYILGTNVHNISFLTGVGSSPVMNIHHRPSGADKIAEPVPGLLSGGPEINLSDQILKDAFTNETPHALKFVDHQESYASNEIAINWNAPLVFVAGYFNK